VTDENWGVTFTPRARRDLRALDPPIRDRVLSVIDRVAARDQALDVRRLTGSAELRVRVGDWRVRFTRDVEPTTAETPSQTAIRTGGPEAYRDFSYGCSSRASSLRI